MRRIVLAASILLAVPMLPLRAQTPPAVKWNAGRLSVEAHNVNLSELLDQIHEKTGMRVIYDGPAPTQRFDFTAVNETPVAALTSLLQRERVKFAMVLGAAGTQVETLLVSTAQPVIPPPVAANPGYGPGAFPEAPTEMYDEGVEIPMDDSQEPPMPEDGAQPAPTMNAPAAAVPTSPPSMASPFTPQGPGPIVLPLPGSTPTPGGTPPPPAMTPIPGSTAERPPWEKSL